MIHFTEQQRYKLEVLLQEKVHKTRIAKELNVHISSIYREIKRNSDARNSVYKAELAVRKCVRFKLSAKPFFFYQKKRSF